MRVVVAYESMYGNTHRVARAICSGFEPTDDVTVLPAGSLDASALDADLLVVGVPTHAHGMPRPSSRRAAIGSAQTAYESHELDPASAGTGVREWLQTLPSGLRIQVATFDTRFPIPGWLGGHPARTIARQLRHRGATVVIRPESFFVSKKERLRDGELDRAESWGREVRAAATRRSAVGVRSA